MSTDPLTVLNDLDAHASELDKLSKDLAQVERDLEPVEALYETFVADFERGLWDKHVAGAKFPPAELRLRMAHAAMAPDLLGRHSTLSHSRKRLQARIATLKAVVDAKRSILSALKTELEASGGSFRRAA